MEQKISIYISESQIQEKVRELAAQINEKFRGQEVIVICVLKGAFIFYSDLIRHLELDLRCEFFGVSSYVGMSSSGEVKINLDLTYPIEGKNVLLVEDIVDTGLTMNYLKSCFLSRQPRSLVTVALLEKSEVLRVPCQLDYVGFRIPNDFVVGYGLDYGGRYRNLPYLAQMQELN